MGIGWGWRRGTGIGWGGGEDGYRVGVEVPVLTSTPHPIPSPHLTPHPMRRFQPIIPDPDGDNILCYENGAMFLFSNFQYIILAVILSNGPPYRQPFYCNCKLVLLVFHHCQSLLAQPPCSPHSLFDGGRRDASTCVHLPYFGSIVMVTGGKCYSC